MSEHEVIGQQLMRIQELEEESSKLDGVRWLAQGTAFSPFSCLCNITGQPAASLPVQLVDDKTPCAVQLAGQPGQDHQVLQASALLERHLNWQQYRPPIWAGDL